MKSRMRWPGRTCLSALTLFALACGGDSGESAGDAAAEAPPREGPRDSLTVADLGSLRREEILLTLPWTTNRIDRDADAGAPPAVLDGVTISKEVGFDRVVLSFSGQVPGYELDWMESPVLDCATGEEEDVPGPARLWLRLQGARAHDEAGAVTVEPLRQEVGGDALQSFVTTCDFEGTVEIGLGVSGPVQVRLLEMRGGPRSVPRLVMDVRVPPAS